MNYESPEKRLAFLQREVFDPNSEIYIENLLDLVSSVTYDIHSSGTFKNTKPIKAFLDRYSNFSEKAYKYRVSLTDFEIKKTIGQGGFGRVDLVKHKETKDVYAMKVIEKTTYIQNAFNGFWEERDILAMNSSDWLVKCFYSFMDLKKLYIVMEYMPGGNLYHWLSSLEEFNDEQTHFYAMEMILAVETLHKMQYLHRDLKPDNMLLDKNGHLKLADFGTCIKVNQGKVKTNFQVGTPDYIAPEVLRNTGIQDLEVGFEIDWWAFGIVIFELFYGETPFEGESTATLYKNIMCYKNTLVYPDDKTASDDFIDFLKKILTEPNERMEIDAIKNHKYVSRTSYSWNLSNIHQHPPPLIFDVSGGDDTSYITFDPTEKRSNITGAFTSNNFFSGENLAFTGFTFNRFHQYGLGDSRTAGTDSTVMVKVSELQTKLSEVELSKQQLTIKFDKNVSELNCLQAKLTNTEQELTEKEQMIILKRNEANQSLESNKHLKTKMESLTNQYEISQRELEHLKSLVEDKDTQIRNMKLEISNLSQNIVSLKMSIQQVEQKLADANADLEERNNHIDSLSKFENLFAEEKNNAKNLSSDINTKNRKIIEYEKQLEFLNNEIGELKSLKNTISDTKINNNETRNELKELREKYDKIQREKQAVESKFCLVNDDWKEIKNERDCLRSELRTETLKKTALEKTRDKLNKELNDKKSNFNILQNKVYETEDQMRVMKQRINVMESEREQVELQCKMYEKMSIVKRTELNEAQEELDENKERYEKIAYKLESERNEWQKKYEKLTAEFAKLEFECNDHRSKISIVESITLERSHLLDLVDKLKIDIEEKKSEIEILINSNRNQEIKIKKSDSETQNDKLKIESLVKKINEMVSNPTKAQPYVPRQKKEVAKESGKRIKQLERDLIQNKATIDENIRELTEVKNECQSWRDKVQELTQLNEKNVATIKHLMVKVGDSVSQNLESDDDATSNSALLNTRLEGRIEVLKPGKGRTKMKLIPSFAVLQPYQLDIRLENEAKPYLSLELRTILHVKETTSVDCIHVDKALLPQMLSIIYNKPDAEDTNISRRISVMPNSSAKNSTISSNEDTNSSMLHSSNQDLSGIIYVENHSFVQMRFRLPQVCDLCHQSCADKFNPPPGIECSKCKRRFHQSHIDGKMPSCSGAIEMLSIMLESSEAKWAWMMRFNQLKKYQKENEVNIAPNTYYRSVRHPISNRHSPNNTSLAPP